MPRIEVDEREWGRASPAARRALRAFRPLLRDRPERAGDRLRPALVPKRFRELPNLYRLELQDGWRALYSITRARHEADVVVRVVFVGNHARYDRLFGYS